MKISFPLRILACVTALCFWASPAQAGPYTYVDLGTLDGTGNSYAKGINNLGQVVGMSQTTGSSDPRAFLWTGASMTALSPSSSAAFAINDQGQIAGWTSEHGIVAATWVGGIPTTLNPLSYATANNDSGQMAGITNSGGTHAARWDGSVMKDLGTLGGGQSNATGINDSGYVVGYSQKAGSNGWFATAWVGDAAIDLGGGSNSYGYAVNNKGQVAGYSQKDGMGHATIWSETGEIVLSPHSTAHTNAYGINDAGDVVGYAWDLNSVNQPYTRATLWEDGLQIDLNEFLSESAKNNGWILAVANGINDQGWVVGDAVNMISGETHGFLLSHEVPEPSTLPLVFVGIVMFTTIARRRQLL